MIRPPFAPVARVLRAPSASMRALPDFLIIGAQKAGTTSLFDYLERLPTIKGPLAKEIHFFDHHYDRGPSWYRRHFPLATRSRSWLTGEASPFYLLHPHAPARVLEVVPDVKLIVLLRHPVARAYSHFQHSRSLEREPLSEFAEALRMERDRTTAAWARLEATGMRQPEVEWFSYLRRSLYAPQLRRWLAVFPRDRLLPVVSERLFDHAEPELGRICHFLGVEPRGPAMGLRKLNGREYPALSPETREALHPQFVNDVEETERLLGIRTGWELN